MKTRRENQHKIKYKSQMRFIQRYKNDIQTNICKNRYDKEIYYFSSINMSECSH